MTFDRLQVGRAYERTYLARHWGYQGYQAISRGVVTPSKTSFIILFVTKEKQSTLTQYKDYIDGNYLHWEGEEKHASDTRIVNASKNGKEIHLFYRDKHHADFVYYGEIFLKKYEILINSPSRFVFSIGESKESTGLFNDLETHKQEYGSLDATEKESIVNSRIGQGLFRDRVIEHWGSCSVTGLKNTSLLRASHIKPWRYSNNYERLDPMNGLLLHPTLDHLFDSGFVTFQENGVIRISEKLSQYDAKIMHVTKQLRLRKNFEEQLDYMEFHRQYIFKDLY